MSIVRLSAKRSNLGWKSYGEQFRLRKAQDPFGYWWELDPELWLLLIKIALLKGTVVISLIIRISGVIHLTTCMKIDVETKMFFL